MPPYQTKRSTIAHDYLDNERFIVVTGDISDQECTEIVEGIEKEGTKTHLICFGSNAYTNLQAKLPAIRPYEQDFINRNLSINLRENSLPLASHPGTLCVGEAQIIGALEPHVFEEENIAIIAKSLLRSQRALALHADFFNTEDEVTDPDYEAKCKLFLQAIDESISSDSAEAIQLIDTLKTLSNDTSNNVRPLLAYMLLQHFFETDSEFLASKQVSYLLNYPNSTDFPPLEKKARLTHPNVMPIAQIGDGKITGFIRVLTNTSVIEKKYAYLSDEKVRAKEGMDKQAAFTAFLKDIFAYLNNNNYEMAFIVAAKKDETNPIHSAKVREAYLDAGLSYVENMHARLRPATSAFEQSKVLALNTEEVSALRQTWKNISNAVFPEFSTPKKK